MKNKTGLILLAVACLALVILLFVHRKQAAEQRQADTQTILNISNQWTDTSFKLEEQKQVNVALMKDLERTNAYIAALTNNLTQTTASLAKTADDLEAARKSVKAAEDEIAKRDARISELEAQNLNLDKRAGELTNAIAGLNAKIAETQRKLSATEGDKAFLEKELQRLMGEKADLEKKFNDLEVLRAQVKRLKEELVVARRLDWIRKGLWGGTDVKGAQLLLQKPGAGTAETDTNRYNLNVEIGSDGSMHVIPPLTNRPATNPPPR